MLESLEPELAEWTADSDLLAGIFNALQDGNWQRAGGRGSRPKPVERPQSARGKKSEQGREKQTFEHEAVPQDEMAAWLGWAQSG